MWQIGVAALQDTVGVKGGTLSKVKNAAVVNKAYRKWCDGSLEGSAMTFPQFWVAKPVLNVCKKLTALDDAANAGLSEFDVALLMWRAIEYGAGGGEGGGGGGGESTGSIEVRQFEAAMPRDLSEVRSNKQFKKYGLLPPWCPVGKGSAGSLHDLTSNGSPTGSGWQNSLRR